MRPGDALQLDGEGTHGPQELVELPIRFLSVVAYGEVDARSSPASPPGLHPQDEVDGPSSS